MKNPIQKGYASINEAQIYYEKVGNAFPVVFIHGFGADNRMWQPQFEHLSRFYQVIRYDVRGFGKSSQATKHIGAEDLKSLLDYLKIDQLHLIGLSMGGNIALNFAEIYPSMVRKLVVVSSDLQGFKGYTEATEQIFGNIYMMGATEGAESAKKMWAKSPLFALQKDNMYDELLQKIVEDYSGIHFTNPHLLPNSRPYTIERLGEIEAKTLIIAGEHDLPDYLMMADILASKIINATKKLIPQSGHLVNLEQPDLVNSMIEAFLNE